MQTSLCPKAVFRICVESDKLRTAVVLYQQLSQRASISGSLTYRSSSLHCHSIVCCLRHSRGGYSDQLVYSYVQIIIINIRSVLCIPLPPRGLLPAPHRCHNAHSCGRCPHGRNRNSLRACGIPLGRVWERSSRSPLGPHTTATQE